MAPEASSIQAVLRISTLRSELRGFHFNVHANVRLSAEHWENVLTRGPCEIPHAHSFSDSIQSADVNFPKNNKTCICTFRGR